jgi:type I restriction-modification system DNA methylase subunit
VTDVPTHTELANFIWSVADLLRGDYKQSEYGKVILPLTVIRRLDCVLEPTKAKVLAVHAKYGDREPLLQAAADGSQFYNTSLLTLTKVLADPATIADQLAAYIAGFSPAARDVIEKFDFHTQIARMNRSNLLYLVLSRFCDIDLHPDAVSNIEMGYLYEELIRRFSELSNETAGEHFTPREVISLMVELLFCDDDDLLRRRGIAKTLFDPACGTGGMLSVAEDRLREFNPQATLHVFGQELNAETYAVCRSDMMIKGQDADNIAFGNSFTDDAFDGERFDYLLANPPFGVEWKKVADEVKGEHARRGFGGRFGAGLPRINDGSFLFLQHMISKMKRPEQGGSRVAIVFNGSPLFTGAAGSGESEIRRWIIENDWLEAVVALPDQLFYNSSKRAVSSPRCARAWARSASRSRPTGSPRSCGCTATSPRTSASRSSQTSPSASSASPWSARYGCAGRSRPTLSPPSTRTRNWPNCSTSRSAPPWAPSWPGGPARSSRIANRQLNDCVTHSPSLASPPSRWRTRSWMLSPSATPTPTRCWTPAATRSLIQSYATTRTSPCPRCPSPSKQTRPAGCPRPSTAPPSRLIWPPKSSPTSQTPGSTTPRLKSATKSR